MGARPGTIPGHARCSFLPPPAFVGSSNETSRMRRVRLEVPRAAIIFRPATVWFAGLDLSKSPLH